MNFIRLKVKTKLYFLTLIVASALGEGGYAQEVTEELRLSRYAYLTQVNPLYAWPAVDLIEMKQAISALKASRAEILEFSGQYDNAQQERIATTLYPTAYLTEMVKLEGQRRALFIDVDEDKLRAYQSQLFSTIDAHQDYLSALQSALSATAAEATYKGLEYHFGRSSFAHFVDGIETYRDDAVQSRDRAEMRWSCFLGDKLDCETSTWQVWPITGDIEYKFEVFDQAPARITKAIRVRGRLGGDVAGPGWAMLNTSDCHDSGGPVAFLIWEFPTASGVPIFRPEVVSDVLVHDHKVDEGSNAYERILNSLGMDGFLFQPHTNLYACPDAAGDSAKLRSMVYIYGVADQLVRRDFEGNDDVVNAAISRISEAAENLRSSSVLTENMVQIFVYELTSLLAGFDRDFLVSSIGEGQVAWFETTALAYRLQTPYFSRDIMNLVYGNTAIADYVPYASWDFIEELLFTRNGPELLLGGNNPSIIHENYPQIEQYRKGVSPRLRSYVHDLSMEFNEQDLIDILLKGLIAEHRLARFQKRPYLFAD
jgi:hypothetical protein|tara:strand:+ start:5069 stop:6688 length:1620 start_codon:yes stop_codon:yes gene_type:complete